MALWPGVPYEYTSRVGGLVFTAGACPLDEGGAVVAPGDVEAQAARTVENLVEALAREGAGIEQLVKTTIYVATSDRADLIRAWNVVAARIGRVPSTLLGVAVLGYEGQLVEIEAVAFTRPEHSVV